MDSSNDYLARTLKQRNIDDLHKQNTNGEKLKLLYQKPNKHVSIIAAALRPRLSQKANFVVRSTSLNATQKQDYLSCASAVAAR